MTGERIGTPASTGPSAASKSAREPRRCSTCSSPSASRAPLWATSTSWAASTSARTETGLTNLFHRRTPPAPEHRPTRFVLRRVLSLTPGCERVPGASTHARPGRGPGVRQRAIGSRLAPASVERQQRCRRYRVPCDGAIRSTAPIRLYEGGRVVNGCGAPVARGRGWVVGVERCSCLYRPVGLRGLGVMGGLVRRCISKVSRQAARRNGAPAGANGWLLVSMCQIASVSLRERSIWATLGPRWRPRRRLVFW
jgi:hypothetical protein